MARRTGCTDTHSGLALHQGHAPSVLSHTLRDSPEATYSKTGCLECWGWGQRQEHVPSKPGFLRLSLHTCTHRRLGRLGSTGEHCLLAGALGGGLMAPEQVAVSGMLPGEAAGPCFLLPALAAGPSAQPVAPAACR